MGLLYAIESSESMIADVKEMGIDASEAEEMISKAKKTHESQNYEDAGALIGDLKDVLSELEEQLAQKTSEFIEIIQSNIDSGKKIKADMSEAESTLNKAKVQLSEESKLAALSTARQSDSKAKAAIENRVVDISDLIVTARKSIDEAKYLNAPVSEAESFLDEAQKEFDDNNYIKAESDANSAIQTSNKSRDEQIQRAIRYKEKISIDSDGASTAVAEGEGALAQETELQKKPSAEEMAQKVCPTCGADATYVEQYDRYYCYTCSAYIEPVDRDSTEAEEGAGAAEPEIGKVCPKCSGEPKYVEQYQRYYCYTCNEYVEPVEKTEAAVSETAPEGPAGEKEEDVAAKVCPTCGSEPKYVEQYQRYYCYTCSEYVEPVEKAQLTSEEEAPAEDTAEQSSEEEAAKKCPKCGGEPKYVEQYQRYYCYTCSEYVEPVEKEEKAEEEEKTEERTCPDCDGTATYVEQYDRYYCYTCSKYI
jgi:ribosomal protein S27AE